MDHIAMIVIIFGYTVVRKIFMANLDRNEWVTNSLCEIPRCSSSK